MGNVMHKKSNGDVVILFAERYRKPRLRRVPKKTQWSTRRLEKIFFPSKDEVLRANDEKFVKWVLKQLKKTGQTLEKGQNYNACALYLNEKNLDWLHNRLDPMVYLNYSPTTSKGLTDNVLGISLKDVVQDINI